VSTGDFPFRLAQLERIAERGVDRIEKVEGLAEKHEIELHGERGVYFALTSLAEELKWTRRALWGLAAALIVASAVFALGTLGAPT
jgi:hypothetical protein